MRLETFAVAAVVVAFSGCTSAGTANRNPRVSKAPTPANDQEVVIHEYKFVPYTRTVAAGTTVTWINYDIAPHTATYRSFGTDGFDSGNIGITQIYTHRFRNPGTYDYICILHQGMRGKIIVQ